MVRRSMIKEIKKFGHKTYYIAWRYLSWVPVQLATVPHVGRQNVTSKLSQVFNNKKWRTLGLNQSRRLVSRKHYQRATAVTDRASTNRRYIVIGRLAYFVLSYPYMYPHVTVLYLK